MPIEKKNKAFFSDIAEPFRAAGVVMWLLLILWFSVSSVSGARRITEPIEITGNEVWTGEIVFDGDGEVDITGSLIISGAKITTTPQHRGGWASNAFWVMDGGSLTLNEGTFFDLSNISTDPIPTFAIQASEGASVTIDNAVLSGARAKNRGMGIIYIRDNSKLDIINGTVIRDNTKTNAQGPIIFVRDSDLTIRDSEISGNTSESVLPEEIFYHPPAGIIGFEGKENRAVITNSTFSGNSVLHGAVINIYAAESVSISGSTFSGNRQTSDLELLSAGAILARGGTVLNLGEGNVFENNSTKAGRQQDRFTTAGAILSIASELNITGNNRFAGNDAACGGAISAEESVITISGESLFSGNHAYSYGGAAAVKNGTLNIRGNSRFVENYATEGFGGAVWGEDAEISIENAAFTGNYFGGEDNYNGNGAAVGLNKGRLTIGGSSFTDHNAKTERFPWGQYERGEYLGGVVFGEKITMNILDGNTFSNNQADYGGVFFIFDSEFTFGENNLFDRNHARWVGGVACINDSEGTIGDGNRFTNNDSGYGGAIAVYYYHDKSSERYSYLTIGASEFLDNNSSSGGAIYDLTGDLLTLNGTVFERNKASKWEQGMGGAIWLHDLVITQINDARFIDNEASDLGGAIGILEKGSGHNYMADEDKIVSKPNVVIKKAVFRGNKTTMSEIGIAGGALYVGLGSYVKMGRVLIRDNYAEAGGGGIAARTFDPELACHGVLLRPRNGAVIFDNKADGAPAGMQDLFLMRNEIRHEISSSMFTGGVQLWTLDDTVSGKIKTYLSTFVPPDASDEVKHPPVSVVGTYGGTTVSGMEVFEADVIFENNEVHGAECTGTQCDYFDAGASGGAIGVDGVLEIGESGVSFDAVKTWEDEDDRHGIRPPASEFLNAVRLSSGGEVFDPVSFRFVTQKELDGVQTSFYSAESDPNVLYILGEKADGSLALRVEGLPEKDGGWQISESMPYYDGSISGDAASGFAIVNRWNGELPPTSTPTPTAAPTPEPTSVPTGSPDRDWFRLFEDMPELPQTGFPTGED